MRVNTLLPSTSYNLPEFCFSAGTRATGATLRTRTAPGREAVCREDSLAWFSIGMRLISGRLQRKEICSGSVTAQVRRYIALLRRGSRLASAPAPANLRFENCRPCED